MMDFSLGSAEQPCCLAYLGTLQDEAEMGWEWGWWPRITDRVVGYII